MCKFNSNVSLILSLQSALIEINRCELKRIIYARFCNHLSTLSTPLRTLLKDDSEFLWTKECDDAFVKIKSQLIKPPVLALYSPDCPLNLHCDASPTGLGCVLSTVIDGVERPIAYAHKSLSPTQMRYAQLDREALALVWGVSKFHKYVFGRKFSLFTDHRPLLRILGENQSLPSVAPLRLYRWAIFLSQYSYTLLFRPGQANQNADMLSRLPPEAVDDSADYASRFYVRQVQSTPGVTLSALQDESEKDEILSSVRNHIRKGWGKCDQMELLPFFKKRYEFTLKGEILLWGRRVVIPTALRTQVLDTLHFSHPGIDRMRRLARMHVWWPKIDVDIEARVESCNDCQAFRSSPRRAEVLSWPSTNRPMQRIHIDYAPKFKGKALLIMVDAYSQWVEVGITGTADMSSERTVEILSEWFSRWGYPEEIVSDNGTPFKSQVFRNFVKEIGARHSFTAPYTPSTNGAAERTVQSVKRGLSKILNSSVSTSLKKAVLQWVFAFRFTPSAVRGSSPAQLFLNREIRSPLSILCPPAQTAIAPPNLTDTPRDIGKSCRFKIKPGGQWLPAKITEVLGRRHYLVEDQSGQIHKRHRDHLLLK